jgi:hypothetical protein
MNMQIITTIRDKYAAFSPFFDERTKKYWAATEAMALGRGGISAVSLATGIHRLTIRNGIKDIQDGVVPSKKDRLRQPGGGRKKITETQPKLLDALKELVAPHTLGDPTRSLQWTSKSLDKLVAALRAKGFTVGVNSVRKMLKQCGYTLQSNRKTRDGKNHPDRNAQFEYINQQVRKELSEKQPVISVDSKKRENIGNYAAIKLAPL